jgi:ankyrin repeat protein
MSFNLKDDLIHIVFENAQAKYEFEDITKLPPIIANFVLVHAAQGVIDNGGYKAFFQADWPNNQPYRLFVNAYRAIGCEKQANDFERVIASFPFDSPHLHADLRNKYMDENYDNDSFDVKTWGDALCGDEEVESNLEAYIIKHKSEFLWLLPHLQFPDVKARQVYFSGPIHDAAKSGDMEKIKALLKGNPELVSCKGKDDETPLHLAAENGHKDVVELLLANNADVNARSNGDWTPLQNAVVRGNKDVAELLLANGADLKAKKVFGMTLLHMLVMRNNKDMVTFVLAKGADINAKDNQGDTPLHTAASMGYKDLAEVLVSNKADVNVKNHKGATPLQEAAKSGKNDVAELLSQHSGSRIKLLLQKVGLGKKQSQ